MNPAPINEPKCDMPKTWHEKMQTRTEPEITPLDKPFAGFPAGAMLLISTPLEIQEVVAAVPKGKAITTLEIRQQLAKKHRADVTCPLTTGIFLRIVAEAALVDEASGKKRITPFWRAIDPKSPLAKKLSCGPEYVKRRREEEGILNVPNSKKG